MLRLLALRQFSKEAASLAKQANKTPKPHRQVAKPTAKQISEPICCGNGCRHCVLLTEEPLSIVMKPRRN